MRLTVDETTVGVEAVALRSPLTDSFDAQYLEAVSLYERLSASDGMQAAGEPPRSGAHQLLVDLTVVAPPSMRGIGQCVQYTGGTGSEWTIRWEWAKTAGDPVTGDFEVVSGVDRVRLSPGAL